MYPVCPLLKIYYYSNQQVLINLNHLICWLERLVFVYPYRKKPREKIFPTETFGLGFEINNASIIIIGVNNTRDTQTCLLRAFSYTNLQLGASGYINLISPCSLGRFGSPVNMWHPRRQMARALHIFNLPIAPLSSCKLERCGAAD
jgi:hypothetical protein